MQCQWSRLLPWLKKNKWIRPTFIWNRRLFIKIYTCTRHLKGTLQLIETRLLFGNIRYIYTPLCKPGREQRLPCTSAIHLQPGRGVVCVSSLLWLQAGTAAQATERLTACECFWTVEGLTAAPTAHWTQWLQSAFKSESPITPVKVARFVSSCFWQKSHQKEGGNFRDFFFSDFFPPTL